MKICTSCSQSKELDEFHRNKKFKDGHTSKCKLCTKEYDKKRQLLYPEKHSRQQKQWRTNNPEKFLLARARQRAREKRLDFNIDISDIKIPEVCPVLGIRLIIGNDIEKRDLSPSLDRIDNTKGYIKGNVQVISWRANDLKRNATISELKKILAFMEEKENAKNY